MKNSKMTTDPIVTAEKDQMWRRKKDHKALIVIGVYGGKLSFYEHGNPEVTGWCIAEYWHEKCYLMSADDVLEETGGIGCP